MGEDEGAKQKLLVPGYANYKVILHNSWDLKVIHRFLLWDGFKVLPGCFVAKVFWVPSSFSHDLTQTHIGGVYD